MNLTDQRERLAAGAHRRDLRQQIRGQIGIRAEAQHARRRFVRRRRRDELRDDVQAAAQRVARDMRVVRAQVVLLQVLVVAASAPGSR